MSHYDDAVTLLTMADQSAARGIAAAEANGDPMAGLSGMIGAAMHILVAQVHATLAVADATRASRAGGGE